MPNSQLTQPNINTQINTSVWPIPNAPRSTECPKSTTNKPSKHPAAKKSSQITPPHNQIFQNYQIRLNNANRTKIHINQLTNHYNQRLCKATPRKTNFAQYTQQGLLQLNSLSVTLPQEEKQKMGTKSGYIAKLVLIEC
ncbi:hypothetical protein HS088_TW21G00481 [Tripterygium wilfordii]|uniref:Uncharacterized protein n=1 Tax=Tripterygium wilfordii TaxID=458696 RepID=A0A7J7C2F6_TRIWF|nr:hypothetical protein HS088_TW21G00481 [Tripterygium wilfordii]